MRWCLVTLPGQALLMANGDANRSNAEFSSASSGSVVRFCLTASQSSDMAISLIWVLGVQEDAGIRDSLPREPQG